MEKQHPFANNHNKQLISSTSVNIIKQFTNKYT